MAKAIMIQGTSSHVGKSVLAAALCHILTQDGHRVAPFKSWNMALNSFVTRDGGEIGRAQGEQAAAAGIEASVHMNPILIKPKGKGQAQVIIRGQVHGDMDYSARSGRESVRFFMEIIRESFDLLAQEFDIIVIEGAGSPAEINLARQDVANMRVAHLADAPVLLVSDVDQGGALAAVVGTMLLLPEKDRKRVAGFIFNKFRGDRSLLAPGLAVVEQHTGRPVLGVVPYLTGYRGAEEDGVALERRPQSAASDDGRLRIYVTRLPHISNFTDMDALAAEEDVCLSYVHEPGEMVGADAVIIPGTKNSIADLHYLYESGLAAAIGSLAADGTAIVGICGGYQILGRRLEDPEGRESNNGPHEINGFGLLDTVTRFHPEKKVKRLPARGLLQFAAGKEVEGYEIHMGRTERLPGCRPAFSLLQDGEEEEQLDGAVSACGRVWGTYLHGVFDRSGFRRAWLNELRRRRGWPELVASSDCGDSKFGELAREVRDALDMPAIRRLLGLPRLEGSES
jgi:adenosylcobyric acid synthase